MIWRCERLRSILACLALAATAVAGVPRYDCVCPDGHRKPFCLGFVASPRCCPADPGRAGTKTTSPEDPSADRRASAPKTCPHCRPAVEQPETPDPLAARVTSPHCLKSFVPGSEAVAAPTEASDALISSAAWAAASPLVFSADDASDDGLAARDFVTPPPPDLVITLRHLVI